MTRIDNGSVGFKKSDYQLVLIVATRRKYEEERVRLLGFLGVLRDERFVVYVEQVPEDGIDL